MQKVRVGLIGCGAIGELVHLPSYVGTKKVDLIALCDIDKERAQRVAKLFDVPHVYTDYKELLSREDIDAVSICTPNALHYEMAVEALQVGKHVMCEKPMTTSMDDAKKLVELQASSGKQFGVAFTHRFNKWNQLMKEVIDSGKLGKPLSIRVRLAHEGPYKSWEARTDWFFNKEMACGGALLDMGIHAIDIMRYFMGDIAEIKGQTATLKHPIEAEDHAIGMLRFTSGAVGYFESAWMSKLGYNGIEIYCEEGSILHKYGEPISIYTDGAEGGWYSPNPPKKEDGGLAQMSNFIGAILGHNELLTSVEDGLKSVEAAYALYASEK